MNRQTLLDLIPAYAIDALDPDEKAEVESLLQTDAEAQALLAEFQAIADVLPMTVPLRQPPASLQTKLRQQVRERQRAQATFRFPTRVLLVAAAFILVAAGLVYLLLRATQPNAASIYQALVTDVESVRVAIVPNLSDTIHGELVYSADGSQAVIRVNNLPPIDDNQAYELWYVVAEGHNESAGVYQLPEGTNFIEVPLEGEPITTYTRLWVSIENEQGSPINIPTGPRVFAVSVQPE